mgnify:CR=1 FL=1
MGEEYTNIHKKQIIETICSQKSESSFLRNTRENAYELFERLPMPDFRYGMSIKLDISPFDINKINPLEKSKKDMFEVLSEDGVVVEDIRTAIKTNQEVRKYFMRNVVINDKISAMNIAFWQNGKVIHIPKGTVMKKPIEILSKIYSNNLIEYVLIIVEPDCDVSIVEEISSKEDNIISYNGKVVEIIVKENSVLHYANVQNLSKDYFNFVRKRAVVESNSTMNWLDCCLGSRFTKSDITTVLKGQGAVTNNYGIFFGSSNQQFDLHTGTIHAERNTICDMLTKGALNNKARAVYSGLVKINSNASNSNGYQKEDTLLLSPDAEADSIPQLEIDNNEVRCTHGATVGQVDKEKLFYLMSRSLPENTAKKLIVEGFFEPMIQKISVKHIQEKLREIVEEKIVI